jgi:hypothetical protein
MDKVAIRGVESLNRAMWPVFRLSPAISSTFSMPFRRD